MTFREVLRSRREAAGLTQEALARKADTSVANVRNYEQGIRLPTFPIVVKIAAALGVTCEVFSKCEDVVGEAPEEAAPKKGGRKK